MSKMGWQWRSALVFASVLVACEPPASAPAAPDGGSTAEASVPLPPITPSPLMEAVIKGATTTIAPNHYRDYPVSIPGVLTIRAPPLDSQSHGVGREPLTATFLVTNETTAPIDVGVADLVLRSDEPSLPPDLATQPMGVTDVRVEGVAAPIEHGKVTFSVPPRRQIMIELVANFQREERAVGYRVKYHHEAVFSVGERRVLGHGYVMYFFPPHHRARPAAVPSAPAPSTSAVK